MKDQSKKLQNLKEDSNAVFQELFGLGKKQEEPEVIGTGYVEKVGEGMYRMGNSLITGLVNTVEAEIMHFNWADSKLNWLLDCEFEGVLNLDLRNEVLIAFAGIWKSGVFRGKTFANSEISSFEGGEFGVAGVVKPVFVPEYTRWKTNPINFADGTILRETGGILGIEDAPNGPITGDINIISIPPRRTIEIRLRSNVIHKINFIKRIDDVSSNFVIEIENGETNQVEKKTIGWESFRMNGGKDMVFNPNKSASILGFKLSDRIVSAKVVSTGKASLKTFTQPGEQAPPAGQESLELSNIPFLGINKIPRKGGSETSIYFNFPTQNHLQGYNNAVKSIKNGWIKSYITQAKSALDNNVITGAPVNYRYLSGLIGTDADADVNTLDKDLINSLNGLENFLKYFVDTMVRRVRKTGKEKGIMDIQDEIGKNIVKNRLKSLLGVESEEEKIPTTTPSAAPVAKKPPKLKVPRAKNESIRRTIRDIILNNFK